MALLKGSRKDQKNAARTVISKNKVLASKTISKKKTSGLKTKASIGGFLKKDKTPSKSKKSSSSNKSNKPPGTYSN